VESVASVLVVSADADVADVAQASGVEFLPEPGPSGLNVALTYAASEAQSQGATGVLVVPGDLPQMDVVSLEAVLNVVPDPPAVVIVPDRREHGTNVLLLAPPDLLPFSYGPGSFRRHVALAEARGVQPVICRIPELAIDADLPEDLALIEEDIYLDRTHDDV
jgi:2-phospho-L-lactate guanylyltransferase